MTKREFKVIVKANEYTLISYEKKYIGTEYVIAGHFDEENFSWDSASDNYYYSVEDALAGLARKLGSDMVKSKEQTRFENEYDIPFFRLRELAEKAIDYVADSDEGIEYCLDTMEMEMNECKYFDSRLVEALESEEE